MFVLRNAFLYIVHHCSHMILIIIIIIIVIIVTPIAEN
jgi:hypothetical protein